MDESFNASIYVPPEVARRIAVHCDKPDLQKLRLVCRSFEMGATIHLFDRVWLAPRYADLEIAKSVAARFGSFIKTIMYTSEKFKCPTWEVYREETKDCEHFEDERIACHVPGCNEYHLYHHWAQLGKLYFEQKEILESGEIYGLLCSLLKTLPQVHRVVLTDDRRKHGDCWCRQIVLEAQKRSHNPLRPRRICSPGPGPSKLLDGRKRCTFHESGLPHSASSGWPVILRAISKTGKGTINELVIAPIQTELSDQFDQSTDDEATLSIGLNLSLLNMDPRQRFHASNVLPRLTSLTLSLNTLDHFQVQGISTRGNSQKYSSWPTTSNRCFSHMTSQVLRRATQPRHSLYCYTIVRSLSSNIST